jgi:hypothetical protein
VLGVYIGERASERNLAKLKDVSKFKSLANKLECLVEFAKSGFHSYALSLLLCCAAPSPNYVIRASRPADALATAEAADEMIVSAFAEITSPKPSCPQARASAPSCACHRPMAAWALPRWLCARRPPIWRPGPR